MRAAVVEWVTEITSREFRYQSLIYYMEVYLKAACVQVLMAECINYAGAKAYRAISLLCQPEDFHQHWSGFTLCSNFQASKVLRAAHIKLEDALT